MAVWRPQLTVVQEAVVRSRDAVLAGTRSRKKALFGSGISRCTVYGEEARVPTVAGLILVSGVYDVIKQFRYEAKLGIEERESAWASVVTGRVWRLV